MATQSSDLPAYEELINSLADKLDGLSVVHQGLGDAARSLVEVQRELADTKRGIESLTTSNEGMLEEVRRLQPAELGATVDASLSRAAKETSEGLGALGERLLSIDRETAKIREQLDTRFIDLGQHLATQDKTLREQLGAVENSFASSLAATQCEVTDSLASSRETVLRAVADLSKRQDALSEIVADVQRRQIELPGRIDELLQLIADLQQHQAELGQQVASLSEAIAGVRNVVDTTESSVLGVREVTDQLGPFVASALGGMRDDLLAESRKVRRMQLISLLVILVALGLAWAAFEGVLSVS